MSKTCVFCFFLPLLHDCKEKPASAPAAYGWLQDAAGISAAGGEAAAWASPSARRPWLLWKTYTQAIYGTLPVPRLASDLLQG